MEILRGENLSFQYFDEDLKAIFNLNFVINKGDFVVVMGESGCGKSTLLKMIRNELLPKGKIEGNIYYKGKDINEIDARTKVSNIGFVMQNVEAQIVTDRVYHELAFVLESLSYKTEEIRLKVAEMASYFGIETLFRKKTDELSGGEKQLVNLASVMVSGPDILLLDEPTSKLDPIAANEFINTLKKINVELGTTIILVEHRLEEVFSLADKVMFLEKGRIVAFDKPREVGKVLINHKMINAAPISIALYKEICINEKTCPINVKEGKEYLKDNFSNSKCMTFCEENYYSNYEANNKHKILELKDIWFRYEKNEKDILRSVNLSVKRGEIFSLMGGNGAGKSTLFSIICGLNKPYRGKVVIDKKNIRKYKDSELLGKIICMLPQEPINVFFKTDIYEDYLDILDDNLSKEEKDEKIREVAAWLNIEKLLKKHPYDLSGGELQKCAIAKIMLLNPQIILLDEPTKGIDGCYKLELVRLLKELKRKGVTILNVTHDVEFAASISDRCAMLFDGEIIAVARTHDFFATNNFYTTAVKRMAKNIYENVINIEELVWMIKENM